jgi:hypothetical protein
MNGQLQALAMFPRVKEPPGTHRIDGRLTRMRPINHMFSQNALSASIFHRYFKCVQLLVMQLNFSQRSEWLRGSVSMKRLSTFTSTSIPTLGSLSILPEECRLIFPVKFPCTAAVSARLQTLSYQPLREESNSSEQVNYSLQSSTKVEKTCSLLPCNLLRVSHK